ncbi:glycosyltransferase [Candidatus Parcubacteria bacterium]|nr:MAG: glycosyltransferase [Candidatus Parcubacteria bacterium]
MAKKKRNRKKSIRQRALVDIVVLVYDVFDLAQQCVDAIPEAFREVPWHLIIMDNGSEDRERAMEFFRQFNGNSSVTVVRSQSNIGFPRGNNVAARKGDAPLLFLLNSDCILAPGSGDILVRAMDDPLVGIAGMKLVFPEDSSDRTRPPGKVQHVGLMTGIRGQQKHIFIGWSPDHPKVNAVREVDAVTGAALMVRRSLWRRAGGFYEGYGKGTWEDVDLCYAVRKMEYKVVVETQAVGTHHVGQSAIAHGEAFPLLQNELLFRQRHGDFMKYSEWRVL